MSERKRRSRLWIKLVLATMAVCLILLALLVGSRRPWITPVPGVRVEMTRPVVTEADLGPDSAYRLLLQAVEEPDGAKPVPGTAKIWGDDWSDALWKVRHHPWPVEPPPTTAERLAVLRAQETAAAKRRKEEQMVKEEDEEEDMVFLEPADPFGSASQSPAQRVLASDAPWTLEQYEDIQRVLRLYEPNFALLDRALAAPNPQMLTAQGYEDDLSYLAKARTLAHALSLSARFRAGAGDLSGAYEQLVKCARLGNLLCRGGTPINHLVGFVCSSLAGMIATELAVQGGVPGDVLKQSARELLACADDVEPSAEAVRAEAHMAISGVDTLYASLRSTGGSFSEAGKQFTRFAWFTGSNPAATRRNIRACYQHLVLMAEKKPSQRDVEKVILSKALYARSGKFRTLLRVRDPLGRAYAAMVIPALMGERPKDASRDAELRGTALFLAAKAYEKEHGKPPEALKQLVPDYLPHVPTDPFDGTPFRYLRSGVPGLPEDTWGIYSVGENAIDDGGMAHIMGTNYNRSFKYRHETKRDLVWPSQAYPKGEDTEDDE